MNQRVARNIDLIEQIPLPKLEFDADDAKNFGEVRAMLAKSGEPIGLYDVLIAGQALSRRMCLVTGNVKEFSRVPGLRTEDWQTGS